MSGESPKVDRSPTEARQVFDVRSYYIELFGICQKQIEGSTDQAQKERYKIKARIVHSLSIFLKGDPNVEDLIVFSAIEDTILTPFTMEQHNQSEEGLVALKIAEYFNTLSEVVDKK